jgi:hypothetical protein
VKLAIRILNIIDNEQTKRFDYKNQQIKLIRYISSTKYNLNHINILKHITRYFIIFQRDVHSNDSQGGHDHVHEWLVKHT